MTKRKKSRLYSAVGLLVAILILWSQYNQCTLSNQQDGKFDVDNNSMDTTMHIFNVCLI